MSNPYDVYSAQQLDSIRISLHRKIRRLRRRNLDFPDGWDQLKRAQDRLAELEESYQRRFLD